ncbi:hypothetical protein OAV67_03935 [Alphaproteobacteria bacterium]|nr:hypothetical protein [Alphaproteobacteria bacterium]
MDIVKLEKINSSMPRSANPVRGIIRNIIKFDRDILRFIELKLRLFLNCREGISFVTTDNHTPEDNIMFFQKCKRYFTGQEIRPIITRRNEMTLCAFERLEGFTSITDFGVHYAWLANELATRFPKNQVYGTERDLETIELNKQVFGRENLELICIEDMVTHVKQNSELYDGGVFTTTFTLMFIMPRVIRDILTSLKTANLKYLVITENHNFSKITQMRYKLNLNKKASSLFRDRSMLHNYYEIIETCGFRIIDIKQEVIGEWNPTTITAINKNFMG